MKANILLFTLCVTAAIVAAPIAAVADTVPVGFNTISVTAGNNPIAPTFVHPDSVATVASAFVENPGAGETEITLANVILTTNEFGPSAAFPAYYLEITEAGSNQGYAFDIVSNTATKVTVTGLLTTDFSLSGTESIAIRKHMTIGDLFSASTSSLTAFSDSVKFFNSDGSTTSLFWDGTKWTSDTVADDSASPIYPGEGFLTVFGSAVDIVTTGTVKTTQSKVPVFASQLNLVAGVKPVDTTVGALGLVATLDIGSENIKVFQQNGSLAEDASYFTDGNVVTKDFVHDHGTDSIAGSSAFLLNVSSDKYWTAPAPYTL